MTTSRRIAEGQKDPVTGLIIGAAIEVQRVLGRGLLEGVYEEALARELCDRGATVQRQLALPVHYKGVALQAPLKIDLLVDRMVVVEVKAVTALHASHHAQLATYLRLGRYRTGLLLNFHARTIPEGLFRMDAHALGLLPFCSSA